MQILWLESKIETEWGIFRSGDLIDTTLAGIPDEAAWDMVQAGVAEMVNPEPEPAIELYWDKKKKKIIPIEEKP